MIGRPQIGWIFPEVFWSHCFPPAPPARPPSTTYISLCCPVDRLQPLPPPLYLQSIPFSRSYVAVCIDAPLTPALAPAALNAISPASGRTLSHGGGAAEGGGGRTKARHETASVPPSASPLLPAGCTLSRGDCASGSA